MSSSEQERMDAISSALASILRRQEEFDRRMLRVEETLRLAPAESSVPKQPLPVSAPAPPAAAPPERVPRSGELETKVGLTLANRAGVVTLVIGFALLFKIAVDYQWIGPAGRVILGVLASFVCLAVADFLSRRRQRIFAQGVTATGVSLLYVSIYAAFGFYHQLPQSIALVLMALTTAMAGALALRYGSMAIAALGLVGGFLTPILLSTGQDHPWFLFTYILLLDLGALALARMRRWELLEVFSFAGTVLLYGLWLAEGKPDREIVATFYLLVFYSLFALNTNAQPVYLALQFLAALGPVAIWSHRPGPYVSIELTLALCALALSESKLWRFAPGMAVCAYWFSYLLWTGSLRGPFPVGIILLGITCAFIAFFVWLPWRILIRREHARTEDLIAMVVNGGAYFAASYVLLNPAHHAWVGLFAVALAAAHLAVSAHLWRTSAPSEPASTAVLLLLGIALTFLTLAAPIQFTAYRITISWALEAAAITWIGTRLKDIRLPYAGIIIFVLVWTRLCGIDAWIFRNSAGHALLWNERCLAFALSAACLWFSAYWLKPLPLAFFHYISGHLILLWALTQEALEWAARSTPAKDLLSVQTVTVSILYAIYAVILISIGVGSRSSLNRIAGLSLIGLVVVKLYLFDVWQLSRLHRTLAFVALGLLLLSTSFLYSHFRKLVESWWRDDEASA